MKDLMLKLQGDFLTDETSRRIYATDASAYRQIPKAVAVPKTREDIVKLVRFAKEQKTGLIPRTAGTSLAGQVVGDGIVVDLSKYFNQLLEVNVEEEYVWVQPGFVRDDLNKHLAPHGYFFAPETSTASRAMIGGMIGNNSCGSNSILYGSTREHLLEVKAILSDGTEAWFGALEDSVYLERCNGQDSANELHADIYYQMNNILSDPENQAVIKEGYPNPTIPRRNTGYALDMLLRNRPFNDSGSPFNFCELLAGAEGTLAIITEAKLKLTKTPTGQSRLVCIHFNSIDESLRANLLALNYSPSACELMDHYILAATGRNKLYKQNRFFLQGDPKAVLMVEIRRDNEEDALGAVEALVKDLKENNLGYSFPIIQGEDMAKVWVLRKAGLGLLGNTPGDAKSTSVIEDTAVAVDELPEYIAEFNRILKENGLYSVHYAHAGTGELHLRPILNLKTKQGQRQFRRIAEDIAELVKKYNGSLSGEHGDGRLRAEFIPRMLGEHNYQLCKRIKKSWDPHNIFNPGKIVDAAPMDTHLRYEADQETPEFETLLDFSENQGMVRAAEQCNGVGECRKTHLSGGTMCPSYMATKNEKDTTRARANILREMMTKSETDPFDSQEIKEVMDLCLSCKGCKSECPSNVDVAKLKAEWQHHYHLKNGIPFRTKIIGRFAQGMQIASRFAWAYNLVVGNKATSGIIKEIFGFAKKRSLPPISKKKLEKWFYEDFEASPNERKRTVYFFCDEFTNYNDAEIGQKAILLLDKLGYQVQMVPHDQSGRTYLSKGILNQALEIARSNVKTFSGVIKDETPLVGIEPSALLTFRDEYIDLLRGADRETAQALAKNVFTIEEFLAQEASSGAIGAEHFHEDLKQIKIHGHCHQKALSSMTPSKNILQLPRNYEVQIIPSGCCGMAGSFGYEKEHFDVSMAIGELVLFPAVRSSSDDTIIAAAGTSCRHQIKDGTDKIARHPVEILYDALR